jgi:hypothetical protein
VTVLAAVAGITGLAELVGATGVSLIALAAAVMSAIATFLTSDKHRDRNFAEAGAWQSNADVAATALAFFGGDGESTSYEEAERKRSGMTTAIAAVQAHQAAIRGGDFTPLRGALGTD